MSTRIINEIDRPPRALIDGLKEIETPHISDAMGKYQTVSSEIRPIYDGARVCGPALTVQCKPGDLTMVHLAVDIAKTGDVIVVDGRGERDFARWGYLISRRSKHKGIAGAVIDGGVRDVREIKEIGFPVFARSITPAAGGIFWPGSINTTITCGGVTVNPGDIVVGDEDGLVMVPRMNADAILSASKAIIDREKKIEEEIDRGVSLVDLLKLPDRLRPNLSVYPLSVRESIANWIKEKGD